MLQVHAPSAIIIQYFDASCCCRVRILDGLLLLQINNDKPLLRISSNLFLLFVADGFMQIKRWSHNKKFKATLTTHSYWQIF
jgi:hypothetical protein